jgi:hypothetical protein
VKHMKCELESGWTTNVHTNMIIMRDGCDGDVILIVIEASSLAHHMCPLRSQWIDKPDMSTGPKLLPQHKPSEQDNTATIAL